MGKKLDHEQVKGDLDLKQITKRRHRMHLLLMAMTGIQYQGRSALKKSNNTHHTEAYWPICSDTHVNGNEWQTVTHCWLTHVVSTNIINVCQCSSTQSIE